MNRWKKAKFATIGLGIVAGCISSPFAVAQLAEKPLPGVRPEEPRRTYPSEEKPLPVQAPREKGPPVGVGGPPAGNPGGPVEKGPVQSGVHRELTKKTKDRIAAAYVKDKSPRLAIVVTNERGQPLGAKPGAAPGAADLDADILRAALAKNLELCGVDVINDFAKELQQQRQLDVMAKWDPAGVAKLVRGGQSQAKLVLVVQLGAVLPSQRPDRNVPLDYLGTVAVADVRSGLGISPTPFQWVGAKADPIRSPQRAAVDVVDLFGQRYGDLVERINGIRSIVVSMAGFDTKEDRDSWRDLLRGLGREKELEIVNKEWGDNLAQIEVRTKLDADDVAFLFEDALGNLEVPHSTKETANQLVTILVGNKAEVTKALRKKTSQAAERDQIPKVEVRVIDDLPANAAANLAGGVEAAKGEKPLVNRRDLDALDEYISDVLTGIDGVQLDIHQLTAVERKKAAEIARQRNPDDQALANAIATGQGRRLRLFIGVFPSAGGFEEGAEFSVLLIDPDGKQAIAKFRQTVKGRMTEELLKSATNAILNRTLERYIRHVDRKLGAAGKGAGAEAPQRAPGGAFVIPAPAAPVRAEPPPPVANVPAGPVASFELAVSGFEDQLEISVFTKELAARLGLRQPLRPSQTPGKGDEKILTATLMCAGTEQSVASAAVAAAAVAGEQAEVWSAAGGHVQIYVGDRVETPLWFRLTDNKSKKFADDRKQLRDGWVTLNRPRVAVLINGQIATAGGRQIVPNTPGHDAFADEVKRFFRDAGITTVEPALVRSLIERAAAAQGAFQGEQEIVNQLRGQDGFDVVAMGLTDAAKPGLSGASIQFKLIDLKSGQFLGSVTWPEINPRANLKKKVGVDASVEQYIAGNLLAAIAKQEGRPAFLEVRIKGAAGVDEVLALSSVFTNDPAVSSVDNVQFAFGLGSFQLRYRGAIGDLTTRFLGTSKTLPFKLQQDRIDAGVLELVVEPGRTAAYRVQGPATRPIPPPQPIVQVPGVVIPGVHENKPPAPPQPKPDPSKPARPNPDDQAKSDDVGPPIKVSNTWAIIVGVGNYDDARISPLGQFTTPDALALRETLVNACGYAPERVLVLVDDPRPGEKRTFETIPPTKANVLGVVATVAKNARPEDAILFFWEGHGTPRALKAEEGGLIPVSYLCPKDSRLENDDSLIPVPVLRGVLKTSAARKKILFLEACHSGSEYDLPRSIPDEKGFDTGEEGTVTISACKFNETGLAGIFSARLRQGLSGAAAVAANGGREKVVEIDYLYHFLYETVPGDAARARVAKPKTDASGKPLPHQQHPVILQYKSGSIILARFQPANGG